MVKTFKLFFLNKHSFWSGNTITVFQMSEEASKKGLWVGRRACGAFTSVLK